MERKMDYYKFLKFDNFELKIMQIKKFKIE